MSEEVKSEVPQEQETKRNDKEYNFAQLRKQLEAERQDKQRLEQKISSLEEQFKSQSSDSEESYDEPYVDEKRLNKKLEKFEKKFSSEIDRIADMKAREIFEREKQASYLKANPDFQDVLTEENVIKFSAEHPEMAENLAEMPNSFARQKLLYQSIKQTLRKKEPEKSIQQTIDEKKRSPYYQPSGIASGPYAAQGDYSPTGQKSAYNKMQELKSKLRL